MRNLLIGIGIAFGIGIGIGYFIWAGKTSTSDFIKKNFSTLSDAPATPISYAEAKDAIDRFYSEVKNDPKLALSNTSASFAVDFKSVLRAFSSVDNSTDITEANLRLYPSLWKDSTGALRYSLVIAIADSEGKMTFKPGHTKENRTLFEYIIPCPPRCQKGDFYDCDGWKKKLGEIGVDTSNRICE